MTKNCTKCGLEKAKADFFKKSGAKDGLQSRCKACSRKYVLENKDAIRERGRVWREANKELLRRQHKEKYERNKEAILARTTAYCRDNKEYYKEKNRVRYQDKREEIRERHNSDYVKNRERVLKRQKARREANPELFRERAKRYREKNVELFNTRSREYYSNNKESVIKRTMAYKVARYSSDPVYALGVNIKSRVNEAIKAVNGRKSKRSNKYVGCTWAELAHHIERQFLNGMTWENKGDWHIDHIIPLASAKTIEDLEPLLHFTNLRPLWATDNHQKSSKRTLLI